MGEGGRRGGGAGERMEWGGQGSIVPPLLPFFCPVIQSLNGVGVTISEAHALQQCCIMYVW